MTRHGNHDLMRWCVFIPVIAVLQVICLLIVFHQSIPDTMGTSYSPDMKLHFVGVLLGLVCYGACSFLLKVKYGMILAWFSLLGYLCGIVISPLKTTAIDYGKFPDDHFFDPMIWFGPMASMLAAGCVVFVFLLYQINSERN